jgi:predicted CXXCH cytochrome family protein
MVGLAVAVMVVMVLSLAVSSVTRPAVMAGPVKAHQWLAGDVNSCATCHRIRGGGGGGVTLNQNDPDLCLSCHGHDGSGASTDVETGVLRGQYIGLRSGGFSMALMDPGLTGQPQQVLVTSSHGDGGGTGTAWGHGDAESSGSGTSFELRCTSCHDPHGNGNYRSLRYVVPQSDSSNGSVDVVVQDSGYGITYTADNRRDTSYAPESIGEWCAQCHPAYLAGLGSASAGTGNGRFSHTTAVPGSCLACHMAHGTSATMGTYSASVSWPDGTPGGGSADSRLLAVNNRGVCTACHKN